jgi:hypothetical protein
VATFYGSLAAIPAWAEPRIAVIPFGRFQVEHQLTQALCGEVTCVVSGQVTRQGRVDWARVSAAQLTGVVTGKIGRDPHTKKRFVDIHVVATPHVVLVRKKAPLQGTALSASSLRALTQELVGVLNRAHGPERAPTPVQAAPKAVETAEPGVAAAPAPFVAAPLPAAPPVGAAVTAGVAPVAAAAASREEAPSQVEVPRAAEAREPALLEVQVTLAFLNRQYSYAESTTNLTLRNSSVPLAWEPGLLVGVFPVRSPTGPFAAFGFQVAVATTVGMGVQRENDTSGTIFPAVSVAAGVDLITRLRVSNTVQLAPLLGWQMMNFEVSKASDGTVLTGQPAVHWRAFRVGLKLDVGLSAWCTLFLEASYLYTYSAGPLTSAPYFTSSSAGLSFDTALGLAFRVAAPLEVRLGFVFTRYALDFNGPGPAPVNGVSDQLLGGTLGLRYSY